MGSTSSSVRKERNMRGGGWDFPEPGEHGRPIYREPPPGSFDPYRQGYQYEDPRTEEERERDFQAYLAEREARAAREQRRQRHERRRLRDQALI